MVVEGLEQSRQGFSILARARLSCVMYSAGFAINTERMGGIMTGVI